jgi:hypothetical protein
LQFLLLLLFVFVILFIEHVLQVSPVVDLLLWRLEWGLHFAMCHIHLVQVYFIGWWFIFFFRLLWFFIILAQIFKVIFLLSLSWVLVKNVIVKWLLLVAFWNILVIIIRWLKVYFYIWKIVFALRGLFLLLLWLRNNALEHLENLLAGPIFLLRSFRSILWTF